MLKGKNKGESVKTMCQQYNKSRQAFYKSVTKAKTDDEKKKKAVSLIQEVRQFLPRVGGRKLLHIIVDKLQKEGISYGRDAFFDLMREYELLIQKKKRYTKTTNSYHRFRVYKNEIKDLTITKPNQVFVSDITYIRVVGSFVYLSLVTDYYSRMIVGYHLSDSLSAVGTLNAIKMAMRGVKNPAGLIHHSDRGIQYCCADYVGYLKRKGAVMSMTEEDHVYENALAERVNGILKDEFYLGERFASKRLAEKAVREAVKHYNELRPHMSLNYDTPAKRYTA